VTPDASNRPVIVRGAPRAAGRTEWIQPGTSPLRALQCGRIRADPRVPPVRVDPGPFETALVCLDGSGFVRVGTERFRVEPYDVVYVPRDTHFMVWGADGTVDIAEVRAPVEERHPLQYVGYAKQQLEWSEQHPDADPRMCVLLGDRAAAGRVSLGVIAGDSSPDGGPWPAVPEVPGAEVACCYARVPAAQTIPIEWTSAATAQPAYVHEGDLVVGAHRWRADGCADGGTLAVLWMLAAEHEVTGDRFRLPAHIFSRSPVVP
jgi:mannose-6-phosphate isomerase-like protein (cupin superfamily)